MPETLRDQVRAFMFFSGYEEQPKSDIRRLASISFTARDFFVIVDFSNRERAGVQFLAVRNGTPEYLQSDVVIESTAQLKLEIEQFDREMKIWEVHIK